MQVQLSDVSKVSEQNTVAYTHLRLKFAERLHAVNREALVWASWEGHQPGWFFPHILMARSEILLETSAASVEDF